jgi:hypothetical protein
MNECVSPVVYGRIVGESIDPVEIRETLLELRRLIASVRSEQINRELRFAHDKISEIQIVDCSVNRREAV